MTMLPSPLRTADQHATPNVSSCSPHRNCRNRLVRLPAGRSQSRKVSGVPLLKGTRLPAGIIIENDRSGSPVEDISENFDTPEQTVREILSYAANQQT